MAVRGRQLPPALRLVRPYFVQVTSVSGNDNAMGLDGAVIAGANLIVVGFSAEPFCSGCDGSLVQNALPQNSGRRLAVQQLGEVP